MKNTIPYAVLPKFL